MDCHLHRDARTLAQVGTACPKPGVITSHGSSGDSLIFVLCQDTCYFNIKVTAFREIYIFVF